MMDKYYLIEPDFGICCILSEMGEDEVLFSTSKADAVLFDNINIANEAVKKIQEERSISLVVEKIDYYHFLELRVKSLEGNNKMAWELISDYRKVLYNIPDCKHGVTCLMCKLEWVEKMKKLKQ